MRTLKMPLGQCSKKHSKVGPGAEEVPEELDEGAEDEVHEEVQPGQEHEMESDLGTLPNIASLAEAKTVP